jgi:hypothetical protein
MIHMKHAKLMAMVTLLLLGVSGAAAQSLGEAARAARKNKPETTSASRHYDNDNLPTDQTLSVVGPPAGEASAAQAAKAAALNPSAAAVERQKSADAWKDKLDKQKEKIASLSHELDIDQREIQLHAAAMQSDPSVGVRNVQFNKDEAQYKSDLEAKQKALDAARQEMDDLQEQAHKAGIAQNEKDSDKDNSKDTDKDKDKDKQ